ncbi:hypothetical protein PI27_gp120 [Listeria phage WIL-1]|nr:hypothetical protein PI27_gp120 [Listeria phage WIL-1]
MCSLLLKVYMLCNEVWVISFYG